MVIQNFLTATKEKMINGTNNQIETQNTSAAGFKARRIAASNFFKKALKKEELSKDEIIRKLKDENRQLRQELNDANSRIRELESAASETQTREIVISPSIEISSVPSNIETLRSSKSFEKRDDEVSGEEIDGDSDVFSVEVSAVSMGSINQQESFDHGDEIQSISASACTIPTGNDKRSKSQRRQQEFQQKFRRSSSRRSRGEDAYLNYFSRRSQPLESITEVHKRSLLDDSESGDEIESATSDLSMSIDSSSFEDDDATDASSLMSGRRIPLRAMKSLLRISSTDSDALSYIQDDEPVLFGEI